MKKNIYTQDMKQRVEEVNKSLPDHLINMTGKNTLHERVYKDAGLKEHWVSKHFEVLIFQHQQNVERLNIYRREVVVDEGWAENITWDELQEIKRQCGRGDKLGIEIYPPDENIINDANIRHIWILEGHEDLPFIWANKKEIFED